MIICIRCPDSQRCVLVGRCLSAPVPHEDIASDGDRPPPHWAEACPTCGYLAGAHSHGCPQS